MEEAVLACVPNFAEGRSLATLDALLRAMAGPGVLLLDCFRNAEVNRSIVTIAGHPLAVCEAVARAAEVAVARIDVTREPGIYPRIGSLDVLPFIPVRGLHIAQCAALARETAVVLWERLRLPAYLYAAAATRPDRVALSEVRRGQFEGLRDAVRTDPRRQPDVGGPGLHPSAGAVAVGARPPLVELKLRLPDRRLTEARAIARSLRETMPGVEATAYAATGATELLIKILEMRVYPVESIYQAAVAEAVRQGTVLQGGALVGLLPEAAYEPGASWIRAFEAKASAIEATDGSTACEAARGGRIEACILERRLSTPLPWPT